MSDANITNETMLAAWIKVFMMSSQIYAITEFNFIKSFARFMIV
jgi:hypothetical protein